MKRPQINIDDNKILNSNQKWFLHKFAKSELGGVFRLTGGTALSAFYLEHRLSEDLDFFSSENVPLINIEKFLKSLNGITDISFSKIFDRNIFTLKIKGNRLLKVEFASYQFKNIEECQVIDYLKVDSFIDITVNKLCAMADRFEAKDYVDVYCALKNSNLSLKELIDLAEKKFEIKGIRHVLKSRLLQVPEGTNSLPLLIQLTDKEIKVYFEKLIKDIIKDEIAVNS